MSLATNHCVSHNAYMQLSMTGEILLCVHKLAKGDPASRKMVTKLMIVWIKWMICIDMDFIPGKHSDFNSSASDVVSEFEANNNTSLPSDSETDNDDNKSTKPGNVSAEINIMGGTVNQSSVTPPSVMTVMITPAIALLLIGC